MDLCRIRFSRRTSSLTVPLIDMADYLLIRKEFYRLFYEVRNCTERRCALRAVRNVMDFYEQNEKDVINYEGIRCRLIMIELLEHCFRLQVPKYDVVCRIFRTINTLDWKGFFSHLMLRPNAGDDSLNRTGDSFVCRTPKEFRKFSLVSYLLFSGTMGRYTYGNHERFVDMRQGSRTYSTLSVTLMHAKKEDLLVFLQLGGRFSYLEFVPVEKDLRQVIIALDYLITVGASKQQWDRTTLQPLHPGVLLPVTAVKDLVKKFCILIRTVENPHVTTCQIANKRARYSTPVNGRAGAFLEAEAILPDIETLNKFYERIFPGLEFGQRRPPSLQHACRCYIRRQLYNNWQLPLGIYELNLPSHIQDYLNLVYD